jgi:hypothetical protein
MTPHRRAAPLIVAAALMGCRRAPPVPLPPPIDDISSLPPGPLVFLPAAHVFDPKGDWAHPVRHETAAAFSAPMLLDPDTGAAHRWTGLDASCGSIARYGDDRTGHALLPIDEIEAYSPVLHTFLVVPTNPSRPGGSYVSLSLDGRCSFAVLDYATTAARSTSADGTTQLRVTTGPKGVLYELFPINGGAARPLPWLKEPAFNVPGDALRLSPSADRIAVVHDTHNGGADVPVEVCDLAGGCVTTMVAPRYFKDLEWSPDGARLALWSALPDHSDALTIVEVAHPHERPAVTLRVRDADADRQRFSGPLAAGGIACFTWSPDSRRLAIMSSHEGGVRPGGQDMAGTSFQSLYVVGADGQGMHAVRTGVSAMTTQIFWLR